MTEKNEFFALIEKPVRMCFSFLYEEVLHFVQHRLDARNDLLHAFSPALHLKNFLKLL